ncbi:arylsulfatase, partial [Mycobacterium sp. ITM-2017-0098]
KHGGAHGGYVMYMQGRRLHFCYNFLGEYDQTLSSPDVLAPGVPTLGFTFTRTGTAEGSHTPIGDARLFVDTTQVAELAEMRVHPG